MSEIFSDDVCHCQFCQAICFIQLKNIFIPISIKQLDEIWNKESKYFLRFKLNEVPYQKDKIFNVKTQL